MVKNHLAGSKSVKTTVRKLILHLLNDEPCGARPAFCTCQAADFLARHTVFVSRRRPGVSLELSHSGRLILFVCIRLQEVCAPSQLPVFHSVFMRKYPVTDADLSKIPLKTDTDCRCPSWEATVARAPLIWGFVHPAAAAGDTGRAPGTGRRQGARQPHHEPQERRAPAEDEASKGFQ